MNHIAIIPARCGSKSIHNKNLQKIKGKSLVQLAIDSAIGSGIFHTIALSTDIPSLIEEYQNHPQVKLVERKPEHASDEALMAPVVTDVINHFQVSPNDFVWLLQPTSPFRVKQDYEEIVSLIERTYASSVISVKDIGPNHPNRTYTIVRGELKPLRYTNFDNKQSLKDIFIRNGCFYVARCVEFKRYNAFYAPKCIPYLMPEERSINIDGPLDLILAQALGNKKAVAA